MRARRSTKLARLIAALLGAASAVCLLPLLVRAADAPTEPSPRAEGWLVKTYDQLKIPAAPTTAQSEFAAIKALVAKRTADDIARFRWWAIQTPLSNRNWTS